MTWQSCNETSDPVRFLQTGQKQYRLTAALNKCCLQNSDLITHLKKIFNPKDQCDISTRKSVHSDQPNSTGTFQFTFLFLAGSIRSSNAVIQRTDNSSFQENKRTKEKPDKHLPLCPWKNKMWSQGKIIVKRNTFAQEGNYRNVKTC